MEELVTKNSEEITANTGKVKKSKKKIALAVIGCVLVVLILVNMLSALFLSKALLKKDGSKAFWEYCYGDEVAETTGWLSQNAKRVTAENENGETLQGLKITNKDVSDSYIIVCHRYGEIPQSMEEYAKHFYDMGFNVVLPYLSGHGKSADKNISMGWKDSQDINTWIEKIISEDEGARIVLFGVSTGANAVTLAAAGELPENVRLVVADSCAPFEDLVKSYVKNETLLLSSPVADLISVFGGNEAKNSNTAEKVKDIEIPILFIYGENDGVVPSSVSTALYKNCDEEYAEKIEIPGGAHGRNIRVDSSEYWEQMEKFIVDKIKL